MYKDIAMALNFVGNQVTVNFKVVEQVCRKMVGKDEEIDEAQLLPYWEFLIELID